ncbi:hypothetical protein [Streptosporangium sandarakinum]
MRVLMQLASLKTASVVCHYEETIRNPSTWMAPAQLLGDDLVTLQRLYPSGAAPMCGVVPGDRNVNVIGTCLRRAITVWQCCRFDLAIQHAE